MRLDEELRWHDRIQARDDNLILQQELAEMTRNKSDNYFITPNFAR